MGNDARDHCANCTVGRLADLFDRPSRRPFLGRRAVRRRLGLRRHSGGNVAIPESEIAPLAIYIPADFALPWTALYVVAHVRDTSLYQFA